ncbi:hypothetical protein QBC43DRAFT_41625 [Cladorrhinum sp. PSN259]|nr:hypothetical protein QBC43DRAFT_41625 [Cladorrhinum sp. PSN259]
MFCLFLFLVAPVCFVFSYVLYASFFCFVSPKKGKWLANFFRFSVFFFDRIPSRCFDIKKKTSIKFNRRIGKGFLVSFSSLPPSDQRVFLKYI